MAWNVKEILYDHMIKSDFSGIRMQVIGCLVSFPLT